MNLKTIRFFAAVFLVSILIVTICGCNHNVVTPSSEANKTSDSNTSPKITEAKAKNNRYKKVIFSSKILDKDLGVNIYLPIGYSAKNKYPVLYILHGYTGTEDSWFPELEMEQKADAMIQKNEINPFIIVAPMIENSFGINSQTDSDSNHILASYFETGNYEDYICNEIIPYIDSTYRTIASKEGRYIGGMSMGGWAAIHLAFSHLDMFSKVGGHSPAIFLDGSNDNVMEFIYPTEELRTERDPLIEAKNKDLSSLKIYLDCGDTDSYGFYAGCEQLYNLLKPKGVDIQYHLNKGGHDGEYWGSNIENYLKFYAGE